MDHMKKTGEARGPASQWPGSKVRAWESRVIPPAHRQADARASATTSLITDASILPPVAASALSARWGGHLPLERICESLAFVTPIAALSAVRFIASGWLR